MYNILVVSEDSCVICCIGWAGWQVYCTEQSEGSAGNDRSGRVML